MFIKAALPAILLFTFVCSAQDRVKLSGSVHPRAVTANDLGPLDASVALSYVSLILKRSPAQEAALDSLLREQQDPASPNFHRWLTPEQFGERFGASTSDLARTSAWLTSQGLKIDAVARGRDWVAASGTAAQFESAFRTEIHRYRVGTQEHFANRTEITLPADLAPAVLMVRGLDDFNPKPKGTGRQLRPDNTTSSGAHYLAPDDWATIYNVSKLYASGYDGTGQRIVVVGASNIVASDIAQFRTLFGLQPSLVEMHLVGRDPGLVSGYQGEANLDIEWAGAIARNATIVYDFSSDLYGAVQDAIDNARAPVITMSFGDCDPTNQSILYFRSIYALKANALGITWLSASGDSGPANCDAATSTSAELGLGANFPSSIPEVTSVGGTEFNEGVTPGYWAPMNTPALASATGYIPEVVWNESGALGLWSSGGGPSVLFPKPLWQTGPGVPNDGARDTPDVAMTAATHDGYRVVLNGANSWIFSGTSAATPSFAGVIAILNQYLMAKGAQSTPGLGNINPTLYGMAASVPTAFHDITAGNNIVACTVGSPNCSTGRFGYSAGPGYDLATGLGSIDAYNLVANWKPVALPVPNSLVSASATPNPVYQIPQTVGGSQFQFQVTLTESNGGATTLTGFTIGGTSYSDEILPLFHTNLIPPNGSITATVGLKNMAVPTTLPLIFTGLDPGGRTWTQTASVQLLPASSQPTKITGIANGASYQTAFAPGMELSVFGTLLATGTAAAATLPLPLSLGGATATVNSQGAPFYYASPSQLNIQIPYGIAPGPATLAVRVNGLVANFQFTVAPTAPGIYVNSNSALVPASTAARGSVVSMYITGTGAQTPAIATGEAPPSSTPLTKLPQPSAPYSIVVGGVPATVQFLAIPPFLVGVTQVNFTVPANAPLGVQPVVAIVGGVGSAPAMLTVTQ